MRKLTERTGRLARAAITVLLLKPPGKDPGRPPVLIGSLGGSGTRGLVILLQHAGIPMGRWIGHDTLDSIPLIFFHQRWFRRLVEYPDVPARVDRRARRELLRAAELHRGGILGSDGSWGWKNTRSAWMIPFHTAVYPELRFIHLVRDGRDIAVGRPQGLIRSERDFLGLDPDDLLAAQLELWAINHNRAADTGPAFCAPGHYLELRYEDLCSEPREAASRLYRFVGVSDDLADEAATLVRPSPGIGRWRQHEEAIDATASPAFWATMERFGYS